MDFEDELENDSVFLEEIEHNAESQEELYKKAAEILDKEKQNAIFEDDFADLETEKYDLTMGDQMFLGSDFIEKRENRIKKRIRFLNFMDEEGNFDVFMLVRFVLIILGAYVVAFLFSY